MPAPPFRTVAPGGRPRASDYNLLAEVAAGQSNPTGGNQATGAGLGTQQIPTPPDFIWVRITGSFVDTGGPDATGCTVWLYEEVEDDQCTLTYRDGVSMKCEQPPRDNRPRFPLYELNGCDVSVGSIQQAFRGNGDYFHFLRAGECNDESGASGHSGFHSGDSGDDPFPIKALGGEGGGTPSHSATGI